MDFKSALSRLLRRYLEDGESPRARVVPSAGLAIEVREQGGRAVTYTFDPRALAIELAGPHVRIYGGGREALAQPAAAQWAHELASPRQAELLYADIGRSLRRPTRRGRSWGAGLMLALAGFTALVLVASNSPAPEAVVAATGRSLVAAPAASAGSPAAAAAAAAPAGQLPRISAEEGKLLASLKGTLAQGAGKQSFYVFSDPNCPYCKELDQATASLANYRAVILPLGYKPGSRDLAAAALCASEPAREWARIMASGTTTATPCEKGYVLVDANMRVFEALRLSSTPTLVTPQGTLVTGAATPSELQAVLAR